MPAHWIVRLAVPNNGLMRVHLSRDGFPVAHGQQEDIWMNVARNSFGDEFMEGDLRGAKDFRLISRAGSNGSRKGE